MTQKPVRASGTLPTTVGALTFKDAAGGTISSVPSGKIMRGANVQLVNTSAETRAVRLYYGTTTGNAVQVLAGTLDSAGDSQTGAYDGRFILALYPGEQVYGWAGGSGVSYTVTALLEDEEV